jgi:hypothetical protein
MSHLQQPTIEELYTYGENDPLDVELRDLVETYEKMGFRVPKDISQVEFVYAVGAPLSPHEMPRASYLKTVSPKDQKYLLRKVQSELWQRVEQDRDAEVLDIAYQVGRVLGANGREGRLIQYAPPLAINRDIIEIDQKEVPHSIGAETKAGLVVDYGMGINGLFAHIDNVRNSMYGVYAIQRGAGETAMLKGIVEYVGITDSVNVVDGGIAHRVDEVLAAGGAGQVDVVLASRVHMAGPELLHGIARGSELLRPDGPLIARGPRKDDDEYGAIGYDRVGTLMGEDPDLEIVSNYTYALISSQDKIEANRLVVGRRV